MSVGNVSSGEIEFASDAAAPARTHQLKTWPEHFQQVWIGAKTFEARKNDRDFCVGDVLELVEWSVDAGLTGRRVLMRVSHMLKGPGFGIEDGYVVLSIVGCDREGKIGTRKQVAK